MRYQDLSAVWEAFLAERPLLKTQYQDWLSANPSIPLQMRTQREHFIKTVGLSEADRDAWLSLAVGSFPVPAASRAPIHLGGRRDFAAAGTARRESRPPAQDASIVWPNY